MGEADAEVVGGDVFELVSFVEEDGGGFGEDAGVGCIAGLLLDVEVGEEEVMVDDDEVGVEGAAAHVGDEAVFPVWAGGAEAGFGAGVELVPERRVLGEVLELGAVAVGGGALPGGDVVELLDLFKAGEEWRVAKGVEFVPAEIVGAALHVADAEGAVVVAEQRFKEGDVFEVELFLEVLGAGGDDDALALPAGEAERGQEIGESFASAGTGFDDEVALVVEGGLDGLGHLVLAGTVLEGEGGAGEEARGGEEVVQ